MKKYQLSFLTTVSVCHLIFPSLAGERLHYDDRVPKSVVVERPEDRTPKSVLVARNGPTMDYVLEYYRSCNGGKNPFGALSPENIPNLIQAAKKLQIGNDMSHGDALNLALKGGLPDVRQPVTVLKSEITLKSGPTMDYVLEYYRTCNGGKNPFGALSPENIPNLIQVAKKLQIGNDISHGDALNLALIKLFPMYSTKAWLEQYIKILNPTMEPTLAAGWARYAKNIGIFLAGINRAKYNPTQPFVVANQPELRLYHYPVPPDGTCGYWSLGISRQEAYDSIENMINGAEGEEKQRYLNMIANGLFEAIRQSSPLDITRGERARKIIDNWLQQEQALDHAVRTMNDFMGLEDGERLGANALAAHPDVEIFDPHSTFRNAKRDFEQSELVLKNWCHDPVTILSFVKSQVLGGEWLDFLQDLPGGISRFSMIDVIAELNGINIAIYSVSPGANRYQISLAHQYIRFPERPIRHILHLGDHYDQLISEPLLIYS